MNVMNESRIWNNQMPSDGLPRLSARLADLQSSGGNLNILVLQPAQLLTQPRGTKPTDFKWYNKSISIYEYKYLSQTPYACWAAVCRVAHMLVLDSALNPDIRLGQPLSNNLIIYANIKVALWKLWFVWKEAGRL